MTRLALCVSSTGIRTIHTIESSTIPRTIARREVLMTMALTARNQRFARQWASAPLGVRPVERTLRRYS